MRVKRFTDLRAWQLANRLKTLVYGFTDVPPAARDREFCNDIRESSRSVCSNTSEGFARYTHREFAHFMVIARGSSGETQDHLIVARDQRYLTRERFDEMWALSEETMRAVTRLLTYLRTHPTPPPPPDSSE